MYYSPKKYDNFHSYSPAIVQILNEECLLKKQRNSRTSASNQAKAVFLKEIYYQGCLDEAGQFNIEKIDGYWFVEYTRSRLEKKFYYMKIKSLQRWITELEDSGWIYSVTNGKNKCYICNYKRYDDAAHGKVHNQQEIDQFKSFFNDQFGVEIDSDDESTLPHGEAILPHGEAIHLIYNTTKLPLQKTEQKVESKSKEIISELDQRLQPKIKGKPYTTPDCLEALKMFYNNPENIKTLRALLGKNFTVEQLSSAMKSFSDKLNRYHPNITRFNKLNTKFRSWLKRDVTWTKQQGKLPHPSVEDLNVQALEREKREFLAALTKAKKPTQFINRLQKVSVAQILKHIEPILKLIKQSGALKNLKGLDEKEIIKIMYIVGPSPQGMIKIAKIIESGKEYTNRYKSIMELIVGQEKYTN